MTLTKTDAQDDDQALFNAVASQIVSALNLEVNPSEIDPDAPLFADGLGLDSIDILEIAMVISKSYGVQLRSDDEDNLRIFSSLRQLTRYVSENRTK